MKIARLQVQITSAVRALLSDAISPSSDANDAVGASPTIHEVLMAQRLWAAAGKWLCAFAAAAPDGGRRTGSGFTPESPAQQVQPEQAARSNRPELAAALPNFEQAPLPAASGQRLITKDSARYRGPDAVGDGTEQSSTVENLTSQQTALANLSTQLPEPLASERRSSPRPAPNPPNTVAAIKDALPVARPNENGNWVVQLSAQRSEEEAQSASRAAQAKYAVLEGRQMVIRKKDQGRRGVFYVAQVGPLARDEANALCNRIKGAGGNCFIQASPD
jgi:cell division septation protein DedD